MSPLVGRWAFVIGLIISVLAGFVDVTGLSLVLFILGLIVGFLNISEKESHEFLVALVALLVIGLVGLSSSSGEAATAGSLAKILNTFISFVSAAGLVVAIKQVLSKVSAK